MLFNRTVWPQLEAVRPNLPSDVRSLITPTDARAFDASNNNVNPTLAHLRSAAGGSDRFVWQVTRTAVSCCWPPTALRTSFDLAKYVLAPFTYAGEVMSAVNTPTAWTYSRMALVDPALTRLYTYWSFALLLLVQLPIFVYALLRRHSFLASELAAVGILVGALVTNGALFATTSGINAHIRYGMPGYLLLQALLLWYDASFVGSRAAQALAARRVNAAAADSRLSTDPALSRSSAD
jgi:hypothetical protein